MIPTGTSWWIADEISKKELVTSIAKSRHEPIHEPKSKK